MNSGSTSLPRLSDTLATAAAPTFVSIAAVPEGDEWEVRHLDAVVWEPPSWWRPAAWRYQHALFLSGEVPSGMLARELIEGGSLTLSGHTVRVPLLSEHVGWRRQASRAPHDVRPLPWPVTDHDLQPLSSTGQWHQVSGPMIGRDSPSFPTFEVAFGGFFYGLWMPASWRVPSSTFGRVRLPRRGSWIKRVRIFPTRANIRFGGNEVAGARVELVAPGFHVERTVGKRKEVNVALPAGLPDSCWLYLSRDGGWLDHRALDARLTPGGDLTGTGIEVIPPDDGETRIGILIYRGEGVAIEFKRELPPSRPTREQKRKQLKTVAAFASGDGGTILYGIDSDEATVLGLTPNELAGARDHLHDLIRSTVHPTPQCEIHHYTYRGKNLLVLDVGAGDLGPYGLIPEQSKPVEYYVRRGATTFPAHPEEIRRMVRQPAASPSPYLSS